MRILSLIASATEIVHSLGLGEFQVGRSHECDFPSSVFRLPICTKASIAVEADSRAIDDLVKARLTQALSLYEVDGALISRLNPTHIITQTQCKVCAVSLEDVEQALRDEFASDARIVSLEAAGLTGIWRDIENVARACGREHQGGAVVSSLQARMRDISLEAHRVEERPRVACIEWLDPLMCAGNWVPELVAMANGECLLGQAGAHSPYMSWNDLEASDPDIIVALPCGFDLARTRREMCSLVSRPEWTGLKAVRGGRVYLCDGNQYMNRPGPRVLESLQIFAEIFHPHLFEPKLRGQGWEAY